MSNRVTRNSWRASKWSMASLAVLAILLFAYTVNIRAPWRGAPPLGDCTEAWTTPSAVIFTNNWYREGALAMRLAMYQQPASIEISTQERTRYNSYPPTAFVPIYVLSLLRGHEPTLGLVMKFNLALHLSVAVLLSWLVYLALRHARVPSLDALVAAVIPIIVMLLMPLPLYCYQNEYWADHAVLPLVLLLVLLELARDSTTSPRARRAVAVAQAAVLFLGAITDWYFPLVALAVYVKRLSRRQFGAGLVHLAKGSAMYWLPVAAGLALVLAYVASLGGAQAIQRLLVIAWFRTGMARGGQLGTETFFTRYWHGYVGRGFGQPAIVLLWGTLVVFLVLWALLAWRRCRGRTISPRIASLMGLAGILTVAPFVQVHLLRHHSYEHDFSALKLGMTLASVTWVFLPLIVLRLLGIATHRWTVIGLAIESGRRIKPLRLSLPILLLVVTALFYTLAQHRRYPALFPDRDRADERVDRFIAGHTHHNDVVFAATFEVPKYPSTRLASLFKRVYRARTVGDIHERVRAVTDDCEIALLHWDYDPPPTPGIDSLIALAHQRIREDEFTLYKIHKQDLITQYPRIKQNMRNQMLARLPTLSDPFAVNDLIPTALLTDTPALVEMVKRFESAVQARLPGAPMGQSVSFLGHRMTREGPHQWRLDLLLKTPGGSRVYPGHPELPGVIVEAYVHESQVNQLPAQRREHGFLQWRVPTGYATWTPGFTVVSVPMIAKPIRYKFNVSLAPGPRGPREKITLGWIDLGQPTP